MINLQFRITNQTSFPVATDGSGSAITVCKPFGDPMVAFLTQTPSDDEVVYLALGLDLEIRRHPTPPGRETISGMGYNPFTEKIWCTERGTGSTEVFHFDPETGLETGTVSLGDNPPVIPPDGMGTNGLFFVQAAANSLQLRLMNGLLLGEKTYQGRTVKGVSASPQSWVFVDWPNDELVVIGPWGNEIAAATPPGSQGSDSAIAATAVAYDYVSNHDSMPQVIPPQGILGPVGSDTHPDTPWNPAPWQLKHRLYVANEIDQVIYAGYLHE